LQFDFYSVVLILIFGEASMQLMEPGICFVDVNAGALRGATNRYVKTFNDLTGLYESETDFTALLAMQGEDVAYEVTDFKPSTVQNDMIVGVTCMAPGKVGREFYMTRGHIHARPNRPEMYSGESGLGVMLLESPAGEVRTIEISPRSMCYVPPFWIHRSINVGTEPLVMTFAYPADSGQDYDIIAKAGGMASRIVDDGKGSWVAVANKNYTPRPPELVTRILAMVD
jgi:glucose-6-phosphate isomerase, archaeal